MSWIEEYKLLEKENVELNVIRLLREKIEDMSQLNEKYQLFLKEIREVHLFENRKVQEYLIEKMFEKIFVSDFQRKSSNLSMKDVEHKEKLEDNKKHNSFFTMRKIEPVTPFYKRNIHLGWKIKDIEEEDVKEVKKRKFGEICVEKRKEEKKENKKRLKK